MLFSSFLLPLCFLAGQASSQLIGPVGATTPLREKTHICNILNYGGIADNATDVSIAITSAFENCVQHHPGSRLLVPPGNYLLKTSIILSNATNWAFQLDGLITAEYVQNATNRYLVPRYRILEGYAGVDALNNTINGKGDGKFLDNSTVIINGMSPWWRRA